MKLAFNIVFLIWLISLSIVVALLYRDHINSKYTAAAKEMTRKPGKGFLVPGNGFFAVRDKKRAIYNDDTKAYELELNDKS